MSSRVLAGGTARDIQPLAWKRIPAAATVSQEAAPPPDPVCRPDTALVETLESKIAALERELELREQNALRAGFEKGRAAGEQEAATRLAEVVGRFSATIADLAGRRGQLRRDAEADVVKLAIAIARRVLHRELNTDPEALLGLVKAALAQLENRELARVRVHPEDADAIKAQVERLRPSGKVEIVPDAGLARGAALFETSRGALDASVETQLAEIERGLIDRLLLKS